MLDNNMLIFIYTKELISTHGDKILDKRFDIYRCGEVINKR